ncbi:dnaJ homolog dnj-5 [Aplysia californica]|uniref:DnaJ homolog dnj-5 n=1 Tax=Aplysia californica TaxID=6500 RepID=A0ABM0K2A9_APLCA|nr:dnaJ homolog dnj-5 [Aplysia californica]
MDDGEDPLGKISRQLSELAAAPSSPVSVGVQPLLGADDGSQWTQFSGISPQHNAGVRSLYTWNPMTLPDYQSMSPPPPVSHHDGTGVHVPPPSLSPQSPRLGGMNEFIQQHRQFEWKGEEVTPRYQVSGDLSGRFVDVDQSRMAAMNSDVQRQAYLGQGFHAPDPSVFRGDDFMGSPGMSGGGSPTPRSFASAMSHPLERSLSDVQPRASNFGHTFSAQLSAESYLPEETSMASNRGMHQSPLPHDSSVPHVLPSRLRFDPRMPPPPLFPVQSSVSESSVMEPHRLSSQPPNGREYSHLQGTSGINIDLGTNIEPGSRHYANNTSKHVASDEGREIYEAAMSQWNSSGHGHQRDSSSPASPVGTKPESQSAETTKPSYSDIAKTPKTGASASVKTTGLGFYDLENKLSESGSKPQGKKPPAKKEGKPFRPHIKRTSSGSKYWPRGSLGGDADQHRTSPTSRYGLDSFDDHVLSPGSSSENLSPAGKIRRSSGSSAGSSAGVLEDISLGTTLSSVTREDGEHQTLPSPTAAKCSDTKNSTSQPASSGESLFFDPRRIFQTKNTNKSRAQSQQGQQAASKNKGHAANVLEDTSSAASSSQGDMVLNNGKPTASNSSSKLSSSARQHDYINNDLRDTSKLTNQAAAAESSQQTHSKSHREPRSGTGKRSSGRSNNGVCRRDRRKSPDMPRNSHSEEVPNERNRFSFLSDHMDMEKIEEWCSVAWDQLKVWGNLLFAATMSLFIYLLGVVLYLASGAVQLMVVLVSRGWQLVRERLLRGWLGSDGGQGWSGRDVPRRRVGLEENINLPATGEEAMKRLLACKGKDPYSILGLRADSTDEDIKRYYRKQAVLVHPDKNQEPGAEEAFKVLGHAFEMIGEPSKRKQYDSHTQEANEAEAMREFADMLSKLQTKLQEAANIMHCDNCGGKHRRVPVDRPFYSARFCQRCNVHHSAKEGDVWAESKMLGFYWHYYALMEGHVFDITEWMKCHKEFFQHMKANTHGVSYRIATDGNRKNRHHHQPGHGEAKWEDIINRLFSKASNGGGDGTSWTPPHVNADMGWGAQAGASAAATTANAKKSRRRKKR